MPFRFVSEFGRREVYTPGLSFVAPDCDVARLRPQNFRSSRPRRGHRDSQPVGHLRPLGSTVKGASSRRSSSGRPISPAKVSL
jgi:hypothetical protein